jgi:antitoxin StbD
VSVVWDDDEEVSILRSRMVPVTELRERLREVLDEVAETGSEVVLLRHSKPAAVLTSYPRWTELLERVEQLEDELSVLAAKLDPDDRVPLDEIRDEAGAAG